MDWDLETKKMLIKKAFNSLPSKGFLVVYDEIIDNERAVKTHSLLISIHMQLLTKGNEYTY
jgi:hypothetical protein